MYYLIQSNIYSDPDHDRIFEALDDLGLQYEAIELNGAIEEIKISADRNDVFVYGSVKLARLAKANTHWQPGSFYGGNHLYEVTAKYYQEHLLNYPATVFAFGDKIKWQTGEQKFIKPYKDAKIFTGKVFSEETWKDFVVESLERPKTPMLHAQSLVQASEPQKLIKEARLWIVGGQVVAGVYYRFHGDVPFESEVSRDGIDFAKKMIRRFNVAEAFVMDICFSHDRWKIVEVNCINSAGFYPNLDVKALLRALEIYFS